VALGDNKLKFLVVTARDMSKAGIQDKGRKNEIVSVRVAAC
jgi:hypothetical protein